MTFNFMLLSALMLGFGPYVRQKEIENANINMINAAKDCNIEGINKALDYGADINSRGHWNKSALDFISLNAKPQYKSSHKRYFETATTLIQKGIDVNAQDCNGDTAAHHAAWNGDKEMLDLLYQNNADFNIKNRWGDIPSKDTKKALEKTLREIDNAQRRSNFPDSNLLTRRNNCLDTLLFFDEITKSKK